MYKIIKCMDYKGCIKNFIYDFSDSEDEKRFNSKFILLTKKLKEDFSIIELDTKNITEYVYNKGYTKKVLEEK